MQKLQEECNRDIETLSSLAKTHNRMKKIINYFKKVIDTIPQTFPEHYGSRWTSK